VLPSATPTGTGTLQVTYLGQTSYPAPISVTKASFGVFALNQAGSGPGIFTDVNYQVNVLTWSAQPNEILTAWGTGLGPVTFDESRGAPVLDMPESGVEVYVGLRRAEVVFRGRAPGFSGLDQINFRVPPGVEGCYVPVVVKVGDVVSNFVTLSVAPAGKRSCTDPFGLTETEIELAKSKNDFRIGSVALTKTDIALPSIGGFELSIKLDTGNADFVRYDFNRLIRSRGASGYAPFGQCVVYTFTGQNYVFGDPVQGVGLDAGNVSVTGPKGRKEFKLDSRGHYSADLGGGGIPGLPGGQEEYLVKGSYTISATGGTDVRAFSASLTIPDPVRWTNRDTTNVIPRSQSLTVTWSGGNPAQEYVGIVGVSTRTAPDVGAAFLCTERAAAGSFTVPALVLSALPASQAGGGLTGVPAGILMLGTEPLREPAKFRATGLDVGYFYYTTLSGKSVTFQ